MNIKVAAFTVSEKSSNTSTFCVRERHLASHGRSQALVARKCNKYQNLMHSLN